MGVSLPIVMQVFLSAEHSETEPNYEDSRHMPGPGEYSLAGAAIRFQTEPKYSFPRDRRQVSTPIAVRDPSAVTCCLAYLRVPE